MWLRFWVNVDWVIFAIQFDISVFNRNVLLFDIALLIINLLRIAHYIMEQFPSPFVINPDFVQKITNVFHQTILAQQERIATLIANTNDINCKLNQMNDRLNEMNVNNERSYNHINDILNEIKEIKRQCVLEKILLM